ncbi:hypothetical protein PENANT_c005G06743 [Penicillium antarcticum]|uniref:Extracellular membrane protein CFEM domain-containing protein n=1 Tax=Penicillium antarcticum TaxID=416450 RepID=A0A1V6QF19_9EURO|nr:uncharacterized protein N7508_007843 [Penicillium antarcticum]KAJ5297594.1 hypothetical protein N7508_007843 [Penicillium antarcticum]OQD87466.1 hypothetical protein PENANT_c005G06743 [Penicillium antarcticum]
MLSLKSLLLPAILSLAATPSFAATTTTSDCPQNWYSNTYKGTRCCYGYMRIVDADAFCCVVDSTPKTETTSTATKTATSLEEEWAGADYCFKLVPFTASDYSDQVSSASAAAVATNTRPSTNEATSTSTSTSTDTGSGLSATSGSSSSTASTSVTPTTNAAMPVATAKGVVLGGAGVAAALFVL